MDLVLLVVSDILFGCPGLVREGAAIAPSANRWICYYCRVVRRVRRFCFVHFVSVQLGINMAL